MNGLKYYVKWWVHRGFSSEDYHEPVESLDLPKEMKNMAYAFQLMSRTEIELDGEKLIGKYKEESPRYIAGERYTLEDVINKVPNSSILQSNMKGNHWEAVVKTIHGNFFDLGKNDIVFKPEELPYLTRSYSGPSF